MAAESGVRIRFGSGAHAAWLLPAVVGAILHVGTALLRLGTFIPYPRLLDFASFYAGAWALRQGLSPYRWGPELESLQRALGLTFPLPNSPPAWLLFVAPLTWLPFRAAAWLWLALLLAAIALCAHWMADLAGWRGGQASALALLGVLSFGPVMLSLTLGQAAPLLLLAALACGRSLERRGQAPAMALWLAAVAAKLFPLAWAGAWLARRRWALLAGAALGVALLAVLPAAVSPGASAQYLAYLPQQAGHFAEQALLDDQSLPPWLQRLGAAGTYAAPGLDPSQLQPVTWPGVGGDPSVWRSLGLALSALLSAAGGWVAWRLGRRSREAAFYLWVLCCLLPIPHMERYNLVLLLPGMAWLWGQGRRGVAAWAYLLAGLSRLTHLWARALPWPWAALAAGWGLYAVLVLAAALAREVLCSGAVPVLREA